MTNIALHETVVEVLTEHLIDVKNTIIHCEMEIERLNQSLQSANNRLDRLQKTKCEIDALLASQPTN